MFAPKALMAVLVTALCAALFQAQAPRAPAQAPDLPPGKLQEQARAACTWCHDSRIIVQQRLGKEAWAKEIDKMIKWGAAIEPEDREGLIVYFSTNFPPNKPPMPESRVVKRK